MKHKIVKVGEPKNSKNGSFYSMITLENNEQGLLFYKDKLPVELNKEYDLQIEKREGGANIIRLAGERKQFQPRKTINKDLEALKLAVELAKSGKIPLAQIPEWKDYFLKLF